MVFKTINKQIVLDIIHPKIEEVVNTFEPITHRILRSFGQKNTNRNSWNASSLLLWKNHKTLE